LRAILRFGGSLLGNVRNLVLIMSKEKSPVPVALQQRHPPLPGTGLRMSLVYRQSVDGGEARGVRGVGGAMEDCFGAVIASGEPDDCCGSLKMRSVGCMVCKGGSGNAVGCSTRMRRLYRCFLIAQVYLLPRMTAPELLKTFLELPEIYTVGSAQERAAFVAIYIEQRTVRDAGEVIGVSKSQVSNLAALFQTKLALRISELDRKRTPVSKEYIDLRRALLNHLADLEEESGSGDQGIQEEKIGNFSPGGVSREDWAEVRGTPLRDPDEWN
jgi:hypothetical protein